MKVIIVKKTLTILFQVWRAFSKNTMVVQVQIDLLLKVVCEENN